MNLDIQLQKLRLKPVFNLQNGSQMVKGGRGANTAFWDACHSIEDRFLCYYWKSGGKVMYVGCTSKDYKSYQSNLLGRIANYLQNHRVGATNHNVFVAVNSLLGTTDVEFGRFVFDTCKIRNRVYDYNRCAEDGDLIYMIENLLIGFYKCKGQCKWNK